MTLIAVFCDGLNIEFSSHGFIQDIHIPGLKFTRYTIQHFSIQHSSHNDDGCFVNTWYYDPSTIASNYILRHIENI